MQLSAPRGMSFGWNLNLDPRGRGGGRGGGGGGTSIPKTLTRTVVLPCPDPSRLEARRRGDSWEVTVEPLTPIFNTAVRTRPSRNCLGRVHGEKVSSLKPAFVVELVFREDAVFLLTGST